jgi:MFS family permease
VTTTPRTLSSFVVAGLAGASVLSNTLLIPAIRPLLEHVHAPGDGTAHAFMSVNMLGGVIGAPLLAAMADRTGQHRRIAVIAALIDAMVMLACAHPMPGALLLALRTVQGAASIGTLSLLMGTLSSKRGGPSEIGVAAAAIMLAVALGAPLGTALLSIHALAPLVAGAMLALAIAATLTLRTLRDAPSDPRASLRELWRQHPLIRLPVAWVSVERFAVGCMVVSFSMYAHRVLALDDAHVGALFSWFLFPFVALTYPTARVIDARPRAALVVAGLAGYALALAALGLAPASTLVLVMVAAGVSSAAVYGPSLGLATSLSPIASRASTMALLNAGGSLGMLAGTASAGILSATLARAGWGPERSYPTVFAIAGLAQLLALGLTAPRLWSIASGRTVAAPDEVSA